MKIIRNTTEDDMVASFLRAEVNSSRWGGLVKQLLKKYAVETTIIDNPNLFDKKENAVRLNILGDLRGYKKNELLFKNFPENVDWKRLEIDKEDMNKIKYIDYDYWTELSGGSRLVIDAIKNIKDGIEPFGESNEQFWNFAKHINNGGTFPEIILMSNNLNELVLVEGHVRMTSYLLANNDPSPLEVIVGFPKNKQSRKLEYRIDSDRNT